jgi:DNA polymerase III delta prime subunit
LQPAPGAKVVNEARIKMVSIAKKLLADSQANIKAGEKASATKRDLLSLMVQSNMSPDIRENLKLSDADVIARKSFHSIQWTENLLKHAAEIPTFFLAGQKLSLMTDALSVLTHSSSVKGHETTRLVP